MPEEGKKNNDRKRYPEQPQKRASAESHLNLLLVDEQQRRRSVAVPKEAVDLRSASRTGLAKRGACARRKPCQNVAALAERGGRRAPLFRVSTKRNRRGQRPRLQRRSGGSAPGAEVAESRRPPSYFGKLFQISASFVQVSKESFGNVTLAIVPR
jgi:hypothetical protein